MGVSEELQIILDGDVENVRKSAPEIIAKFEKEFAFPELKEDDTRAKLWKSLYTLISNQDIADIHVELLTLVRIFSREKNDLIIIMKSDWIKLLVDKALLKDTQNLDENLLKKIALEARKCLCNLIFNCRNVATSCSESQLPKDLISRIENYKDFQDLELIYFDAKILFLITALCKPTRNVIRDDFNGLTILINCLEEFLIYLSTFITDPKTDAEKVSLTDLQIDFCCEMLKLLFNITIQEEVEEERLVQLVKVLRQYLLLPITNGLKKVELHGHIVNLLINIPESCYQHLITPVNEKAPPSRFTYNHQNMIALQEIINLLEDKFKAETNVSSQKDSLLPILSLLHKFAKCDRNMRKYMKQQILPPLKEVYMRPEEGSTLRNHLCRLLTTPITEVRDFVAEMLFTLCKENVGRMIKYTGYGNAAGLFANRGLLGGRNKNYVSNYSSDSDSDTDEYKEFKDAINPIMGCYEPPHPNPLANMSEEQKEYEAMKLVELIDTLTKQGVIKPCKIGEDGKPQEIEHVLELQEDLKNMPGKNDSDSD